MGVHQAAHSQRVRRLDGPGDRRDRLWRPARRGRQDRRGRQGHQRSGRGGDRRDGHDRDARIRRHTPTRLADAGARRSSLLHARPLLRRDAGQRRRALSARGRAHRRLRRVARGAQRRRDHDPRLVTHLEHARPLGRGRPGTSRCGDSRGLRPWSPHRWRMVVVQRPGSSGRRTPHPRDVLLVRRPAADARPRSPRPGELELRGRPARLGACARPRDPHHRPRGHAAVRRARESRQEHSRAGATRSRHDVHPLHRLDGRGARPDRRVRRQRVDRPVCRDADGPRPSADGEAARPRCQAVAERGRRLQRAGGDVHADAHRAGSRPHRVVHGLARPSVRADPRSPGRSRVRDDRRRARLRARGPGGLADTRQAGGHRPAADERDQHGADDRPDRNDRRLLGHVERRLRLRGGAGGQARRGAARRRSPANVRAARRVAGRDPLERRPPPAMVRSGRPTAA